MLPEPVLGAVETPSSCRIRICVSAPQNFHPPRATVPFNTHLLGSTDGELFLLFLRFIGLIQPIPRNQFLQSYFNNNLVNEADRPYKCFYCHRAYKKSCHLKQHIR